MGMYVKIYLDDNMINPKFKSLMKKKLIVFCHTLRIGDDGMPMVS